jgi:hypothetical protein
VGCRRRRVGGGDRGDSRLESGEGMAEREGRREVVVWDRRDGPEMVKARCVGVKPQERKFLRTKFVLHFILFSSRDFDIWHCGPRRQDVLQYRAPPTAVGHDGRSLTSSPTTPDV